MLIGDFIQLTQLISDFSKNRSEINKKHFEQFIEPIWHAFHKIHEDYKTSITNYRNLILDNNIKTERILDKIREEIILTQDLRNELHHLTQIDDVKTKYPEEQAILIHAIQAYFGYTYQWVEGDNVITRNGTRYSLIAGILRHQGTDDRNEMANVCLIVLDELQYYHEKVASAYYKLKNLYLK